MYVRSASGVRLKQLIFDPTSLQAQQAELFSQQAKLCHRLEEIRKKRKVSPHVKREDFTLEVKREVLERIDFGRTQNDDVIDLTSDD